MKSNGVLLAVEDKLSDAVATKILKKHGFKIVKRIGFRGNDYLRQKAKGLNQNARKPHNVFMLTDLDSPKICPPELIQSWIQGSLNLGFFLRVAVMEVESWVMADQSAFAEFLRIPNILKSSVDIPPPDMLSLKELNSSQISLNPQLTSLHQICYHFHTRGNYRSPK